MTTAETIKTEARRVIAWRIAGSRSAYLGVYPCRADAPEGAQTKPAFPRLHEHMALIPVGRRVVSFSAPSWRLDLDDGSCVMEGEWRSPSATKANDAIWLRVSSRRLDRILSRGCIEFVALMGRHGAEAESPVPFSS